MLLERTSDEFLKNLLEYQNINLNQITTKDNFKILKNGFYICNLDKKTGSGTHWTAFYAIDDYILYFDSFGLPPPKEIVKFCKKKTIIYNSQQIQDINSDACGYYCILFIKYFNDNIKNIKYIISKKTLGYYLNKFIKPFNNQKYKVNELILKKLLKNIFI